MEFKQCTKCKEHHPVSYYWKQSKAKDGLNTWCKGCVTEGMKEGCRTRKKKVVEMFGGKCYRCGGVFNPAVYDFHHTDPTTKEHHIAVLLQSLSTKNEVVMKELEKCVMLCANCHRVVHAKEENNECKNGICGI